MHRNILRICTLGLSALLTACEPGRGGQLPAQGMATAGSAPPADASVEDSGPDAGSVPDSGPVVIEPTSNVGNLRLKLLSAGGRELKDRTAVPPFLNRAACEDGSIKLLVSQLPDANEFPALEAWYGSGAGDCEQSDRVSRTLAAQNCTKLQQHASDMRATDSPDFAELEIPL
ncbi:MAG: hypothetical protein RL701_914, partial [Pseudomonadota bacterium]